MVIDEVSTRLTEIEERAAQDNLYKNNNKRPQAQNVNVVGDLATICADINELLETTGLVTREFTGI